MYWQCKHRNKLRNCNERTSNFELHVLTTKNVNSTAAHTIEIEHEPTASTEQKQISVNYNSRQAKHVQINFGMMNISILSTSYAR
jgi:pterin-4a-carbinolamine dehydratase